MELIEPTFTKIHSNSVKRIPKYNSFRCWDRIIPLYIHTKNNKNYAKIRSKFKIYKKIALLYK